MLSEHEVFSPADSATPVPTHVSCAQTEAALTFTRVEHRTAVTRAYATSPLRLLFPRNHGSGAWVYQSSLGGGLVGGDAIALHIEVGPGALGLVGTQAATKVYGSPRASSQSVVAKVGAAGVLFLVPDAVACYTSARFAQTQDVELASDASVVLVDGVSAGRVASGERWAFASYTSRVRIFRETRLAVYDNLVLDPAMASVGDRLGACNVLFNVFMVGPALTGIAARVVEGVAASPPSLAPVAMSASALANGSGAIVRIASMHMQHAQEALRLVLSQTTALLGDDPWARKW